MIECPSAATLARLGSDSLQDETLSALEDHIQGCPDCQAELDRLVQNDSGEWSIPGLPAPGEPPRIPGFLIERELGRGSMSVVYRARQPSLDRLVALKVVRSGPAAGSREYARWLREGRSFSLLRHENVVRLYDVGEAGGWLYLVLEYVPGGTLNERLDAPYAARDAARLLESIAGAVEAIHGAGLLHLDLKPSNILMDAPHGAARERATPRVGDFGVAYLWDDPDATANSLGPVGPVGTPRYMAPEQVGAGREKLGPAADVYGLGALLYHVITGRPPFVAPSVAETLEQVRHQEPVPPRRLNPAIHRDLETICLKCLEKEPGQRYASARAMADDLRRFLDGVAIAARPIAPAEKAWRWCRRRPAVAALAASLVFSLFAGLLGMFLLWRQAASQRIRAESERTRAEAAQARAEADSRRAVELLDRLIALNVGGQDDLPKVVSPGETISLLQLTRRSLLDLADRLPDRKAMYAQLRSVDARLGQTLAEEDRWDEVRALHESSLREAHEAIRQLPGVALPRGWLLGNLSSLAQLADRQNRPEEAEAILTRALAHAEEWHRDSPGVESLLMLVGRRRVLAVTLFCYGRRDRAGALLLANHRSLAAVPPAWVDERIAAERIRNALDFHRWDLGPRPGSCVDQVGPPEPLALLASAEGDRLPAEIWARLALRLLDSTGKAPPGASADCRAALWLTQDFQSTAGAHRRSGRLDLARRTAARFAAFARLLVERDPKDPSAYFILADAYEQESKNAWRPVEDRPTIERTLWQAIAVNRRALELAPDDEVVRHALRRRERKLDDLLHPR
jgi:tetratricopeptide (TPR) repeat protein